MGRANVLKDVLINALIAIGRRGRIGFWLANTISKGLRRFRWFKHG